MQCHFDSISAVVTICRPNSIYYSLAIDHIWTAKWSTIFSLEHLFSTPAPTCCQLVQTSHRITIIAIIIIWKRGGDSNSIQQFHRKPLMQIINSPFLILINLKFAYQPSLYTLTQLTTISCFNRISISNNQMHQTKIRP
jgi:hypothetical protein